MIKQETLADIKRSGRHAAILPPKRTRRRLQARTIGGAILMFFLIATALSAPLLAPSTSDTYPLSVHLSWANLPVGSQGHLLGTDFLGRDLLAEAMWAARASLAVGILAAGLSMTLGALWGSLSALAGGLVDGIMMRIVDGLLAIPNLIMAMALGTFINSLWLQSALPPVALRWLHVTSYSQGLLPLFTVVFVVSATSWLEAARLSRAQVLSIKNKEYFNAAVALGVGTAGMFRRHLVPNAAPVLVLEAALLVSEAVLMEAGLSYLGLGLGPSIPSWGGMLASAQASLLQGNWWAALVPGMFITTTVFAVNLLGEGWMESMGSQAHRVTAQSVP